VLGMLPWDVRIFATAESNCDDTNHTLNKPDGSLLFNFVVVLRHLSYSCLTLIFADVTLICVHESMLADEPKHFSVHFGSTFSSFKRKLKKTYGSKQVVKYTQKDGSAAVIQEEEVCRRTLSLFDRSRSDVSR
jgi:hypothetical protein